MDVGSENFDLLKLAGFLQTIEAGYRDTNPYHNRCCPQSLPCIPSMLC